MSKPDYSKPGSDPPQNQLDQDEKDDLKKAKSSAAKDTVLVKAPSPLECDKKYYFETNLTEKVPTGTSYADLHMKWLYGLAMKRARSSVTGLKCPPEGSCGTLSTWVQFAGWDFASDFKKAFARVIIGAMCATDPDDVPEGEEEEDDFDDWPRGESGEMEPQNEYFASSVDNLFVPCPGEKEIMYLYSVGVRGEVKDYEPYVAEAKSRAKTFFDTVECGQGCRKGVNVFYVEWELDVATVKVYVWAQILCGTPQAEGTGPGKGATGSAPRAK